MNFRINHGASLQGAKRKYPANSDLLRGFHMESPHKGDRNGKYNEVDKDV